MLKGTWVLKWVAKGALITGSNVNKMSSYGDDPKRTCSEPPYPGLKKTINEGDKSRSNYKFK